MGKSVKWLFVIVALVMVIAVGGAVIVAISVDPNAHKAQITQWLEDRSGRSFQIPGDVSFVFFPWFGVKLGQVTMGNPPGFGSQPFAQIANVHIRVKVLPLWHRQVEVGTVVVDGLEARLLRNAQGVGNWENLTKKTTPGRDTLTTDDVAKVKGQPAKRDPVYPFSVTIGGVQIRNATLSWQDAQTSSGFSLQNFTLETGPILDNQPIRTDVSFHYGNRRSTVQGDFSLSSQVIARLIDKTYQLQTTSLAFSVAGDGVPGGRAEAKLTFGLNLDMKAETMAVVGLKMAGMALNLDGDLHGKTLLSSPDIRGSMQLAQTDLRQVLRAWGRSLPVTQDSEAFSKASMKFALNASMDRVLFENLSLQLDTTTITGKVQVKEFSQPRIGFDLSFDALDMDRYLPPKNRQATADSAQQPSAAAQPSAGSRKDKQVDLSRLRDLILDGHLRVGKLKVANVHLQDALLTVKAENGSLQADPLAFHLYDGSFKGSVLLDAREQSPRTKVRFQVDGIQSAALLKDLVGIDRLSGHAYTSVEVAMSGLTTENIKKTLTGKATFTCKDGAIHGINIAKTIRNAYNTLQGRPLEPEGNALKTDFSELSGTVQIENGLLVNQDLALQSPLLRVLGSGQGNLPADRVDYLLKVNVVDTDKGQGGPSLKELAKLTIPIRFSGRLSGPSYQLDLKSLLADNLKNEAKEKLKGKINQKLMKTGVGKKLEEIVPGGVDGVFKALSFSK